MGAEIDDHEYAERRMAVILRYFTEVRSSFDGHLRGWRWTHNVCSKM